MFGSKICECEPNANLFVQQWFNDCVYTTWDLAGFYIGLSSVLFWIVAQLPQFVSNIKNQSAEALSPWFLFQWLSGDSFNLLGCVLTGDQLATETLTATYFILADCLIISQYIFYSIRAKEKLVLDEEEKEAEDIVIKAVTDYKPPTADDLLQFRKRLATIHIVIPDSGERFKHDLSGPIQDQNGNHINIHHHHPVTYVAGRSGAAMIAQAMQSPLSTDPPPHIDCFKKLPITPLEQEKGRFTASNLGEKTKKDMPLGRKELIRTLQRRTDKVQIAELLRLEYQKLFRSDKAMRRHTISAMNRYGLDCGPPSASRITIHHAISLRKHEFEQKKVMTIKKAEGPGAITKLPVKGVAALASLVTIGTSTKLLQSRFGNSEPRATGYRRVLEGRIPIIYPRTATTSADPGLGKMGDLPTLGVLCGENFRSPWVRSVGSWLGWGSSGLYLGSRVSQIALNTRRQSAEGLSLAMLTCAAVANSCMGISILMRSESWDGLAAKGPWLLGSLGTVSLDIFIVSQAKYFEYKKQKSVADERIPLLA